MCAEPSYVRSMDGTECIALPCPAGQELDTSAGAGAHACARFVVLAECLSDLCYTREDGLVNATVRVTLSRPPSAAVTVQLASSRPDKGTPLVASITLPASDWASGVNVTVSGWRNLMADGIVAYALNVVGVSSSDVRYNVLLSPPSVPIWSIDADASSRAFYIGSSTSTLVEGSGERATLVVVMTYMPAQTVQATVAPSVATRGAMVSGATLTFSQSSWNVPQMAVLESATRNWIDEPDASFDVVVSAPGLVGASVGLVLVDVDTSGVALSPASFSVSQLGTAQTLSAVLTSRPLVPVVVRVAVNDSASVALESVAGAVSSLMELAFDATTWNVSQAVVVRGLRRDEAPGDVAVALQISSGVAAAAARNAPEQSASASARSVTGTYAAAQWGTVVGSASYIAWPVVGALSRSLSPLLGGWNITLSGRRLLPGLNITFGGRPALNVRVAADAASAVFTTPRYPVTGYVTLRVSNADGGYAEQGGFYYTDDCPMEGFWGRGLDCIPCPEGAVCPGGYRMWPLPGYWNPAEDAGFVARCSDPPERCTGGQQSTCGTGFSGNLCQTCSTGYFAKGALCEKCGGMGELSALLIADAVFFVLVTFAMVLLSDKRIRLVVIAISTLQGIRAVGQMASSRLPGPLQDMYYYLSLVSFDVSFLRTQCIENSAGYSIVFWANLVLVAGLVTPTMVTLGVLALIHRKKREIYVDRAYRAVTVFASALYLVLTTRIFQAVYCVPLGDGNVLWADPDSRCFFGSHWAVNMLGVFLLMVWVVGYPAGMVFFLVRLRKKGLLADKRTLARFGYLYNQFRHERYVMAFAPYLQLMVLALAAAVGSRIPAAQLALSLVAFGGMFIAVLVLRPFPRITSALSSLLASGCGVAAVVLNFLAGSQLRLSLQTVSIAAGALLGAMVLAAVAIVIWLWRRRPEALARVVPCKRLRALVAPGQHKIEPQAKKADSEDEETEISMAEIGSPAPAPAVLAPLPAASPATSPSPVPMSGEKAPRSGSRPPLAPNKSTEALRRDKSTDGLRHQKSKSNVVVSKRLTDSFSQPASPRQSNARGGPSRGSSSQLSHSNSAPPTRSASPSFALSMARSPTPLSPEEVVLEGRSPTTLQGRLAFESASEEEFELMLPGALDGLLRLPSKGGATGDRAKVTRGKTDPSMITPGLRNNPMSKSQPTTPRESPTPKSGVMPILAPGTRAALDGGYSPHSSGQSPPPGGIPPGHRGRRLSRNAVGVATVFDLRALDTSSHGTPKASPGGTPSSGAPSPQPLGRFQLSRDAVGIVSATELRGMYNSPQKPARKMSLELSKSAESGDGQGRRRRSRKMSMEQQWVTRAIDEPPRGGASVNELPLFATPVRLDPNLRRSSSGCVRPMDLSRLRTGERSAERSPSLDIRTAGGVPRAVSDMSPRETASLAGSPRGMKHSSSLMDLKRYNMSATLDEFKGDAAAGAPLRHAASRPTLGRALAGIKEEDWGVRRSHSRVLPL